MHNFTYWQEHFFEQVFLGYEQALGFFFWPLIFTAVIGYVYLKQQSYTAAAIAAMILFAVFSSYLANVPEFVLFMYVLVSLVVTGLVLMFLSRRRN